MLSEAEHPDTKAANVSVTTIEHPAIRVMCSRCLLEEHPEVGPGLALAREYGVADLADGGEWIVGDLGRLATP